MPEPGTSGEGPSQVELGRSEDKHKPSKLNRFLDHQKCVLIILICFLSEMYFLIARFLSSGPCKKTADVSIFPFVDLLLNLLHYLT